MSIKRNVIATYGSQAYATLIGIVMLPLYLKYMGLEVYGLVGFFTMMAGWFQLLDMGLTPTLTREVARHRGGALDSATLRGFLHVLEAIFVAILLIATVSGFLLADTIAMHWLNVSALPLEQVSLSIALMGCTVGLRLMSSLFRGAITGFENLVWLSGFNVAAATLRFCGVLPLLILFGGDPILFFGYQLAVSGVELVVLIVMTYRLMPAKTGQRVEWAVLRDAWRFALTIAFLSALWLMVIQTDKLLLSNWLPLAEYGYYTLAVVVAGGVLLMGSPISHALLPRITFLVAGGNQEAVIQLYRTATQLTAVAAAPVALVLLFFGPELLLLWTGKIDVAMNAATIMGLYALGNALQVISTFSYFLQYAQGDLRLHIAGQIMLVGVFIPLLIWGTGEYGASGAGMAWLAVNVAYLLLWVPAVHRRLSPGLHLPWLVRDVLPSFVAAGAALFVARMVLPPATSPAGLFGTLCAAAFVAGIAAALPSTAARRLLAGILGREPQSQNRVSGP